MKKTLAINPSFLRFKNDKKSIQLLIAYVMRLSFTVICLTLISAQVLWAKNGNGQAFDNVSISISLKNENLKSAFKKIENKTNFRFAFKEAQIRKYKNITLTAGTRSLKEVLQLILAGTNLTYKQVGSNIIIYHAYQIAMGYGDSLQNFAEYEVANGIITGKVTNEKGEPLSGASIEIKKGKGALTNEKGDFLITDVKPGKYQLTVSFTGYEIITKEINVSDGETVSVNITLIEKAGALSDVVVIGYGTQKRRAITGAIASVTGKTIAELPVASVEQALQGRIAGVSVVNNGAPGTSPIVRIRGISSISFASDPLYVIDGFPTGNLANFDSRDIESVEVLKDASAAAIYGSRATNGVVLITTKKGKRNGKIQVNYDSYIGTQNAWKKLDLLNTTQYLTYERAINGNAGINPPPRLEPANFNKPIYVGATQTYAQTNTNWQDTYFKSGMITQHNVSVSGGNDISRFYSSAGYFKQDGIVQNPGFERGNFRINSEHNISKVFTFGENLFLSYSTQHQDGGGLLLSTVVNLPYLPVYDPTTLSGFRGAANSIDGADPVNPVEFGKYAAYNTGKTVKLLGTAFLEIKLASFLKFRSTFGVDHADLAIHQFSPIYDDNGTKSATVSTISDIENKSTSLLYTQQLTFDKTFGQHHINVTGVYEQQGARSFYQLATGNQSTNAIQTLQGATNVSATSQRSENLLLSYLGRVNYDFAGKYLLSAAIRRDGLSIWAPGKKYASFPSGSIGWKIDQESFMKNAKAVSELKLRAGYGVTGLNATGIFPSLLGLPNDYPWQAVVSANGATYPFNNTITIGNASYYDQLGNTNLEWEKTKQLNIGLDLGLFHNKITFTVEYFNRKTENLILSVPTPPSFGFYGSGVYSNVGAMSNKGFELQATYDKTQGSFTWNLSGNISFITNKVVSMNTPNATIDVGGTSAFGGGAPLTRTMAGQSIQSFYGWVVDGIFQSQAEVNSSPTQQSGTGPGDLKFKDLNGDGKITDADRTFLGSYLPKYSYALNYGAKYKNFDLSLFFQGVQGNKIFDAARIVSEGMARLMNASTVVLNAWTPSNTKTNIPRAYSGDPNQNVRPSNRWIEDGSYLRLKSLIIGYNMPHATLQSLAKGAISSVRLYVSSQNLLTITKYKGWDPEIGSQNGTLTNGVDYGQYPAARSFQFGLQVGF